LGHMVRVQRAAIRGRDQHTNAVDITHITTF
jgi:hypothetical protein